MYRNAYLGTVIMQVTIISCNFYTFTAIYVYVYIVWSSLYAICDLSDNLTITVELYNYICVICVCILCMPTGQYWTAAYS